MRVDLPSLLCLLILSLAMGCGAGRTESPLGESGSLETNSEASKGNEDANLAKAERDWQRVLASNATKNPATRFDNLSEDEFRARLQSAADEYDFRVVDVQWLRPLQAAPLVVIETMEPASLSDDALAVLRLIDPHASGGEDWEGWAFEGFFLEARDQNGSPAFALFNYWRGPDRGGGQWARSDELYPFEHL